MTAADQYRKRAAQFAAMARAETDPAVHSDYAKMVQSYLRLAVLADQNSRTHTVHETPSLPPEDPADLPDTR